MPLAIVIIKIISKLLVFAVWLGGAIYGTKMFKKIMKDAVADFKENNSAANRIDIIGAYCIFGLAAITMIAILVVNIMF